MPIRFQVTGGSPLELAGTGRQAEQGLHLRFADQLQVVAPFRAKNAKTLNRGNRLYTVSWSTVRQHANEAAAAAFLLTHPKAIRSGVTGQLSLIGGSGGGTATTNLIDAAVSITDSSRTGVTTFHSYAAQG